MQKEYERTILLEVSILANSASTLKHKNNASLGNNSLMKNTLILD